MTELDNSKSDHGSMDFDPEIELGDIMGDDDGDNDGQQVTDNPTGEGDVQKDHHSDGDEEKEKEKEKEEEGGGEWDTTSPDTIDKLSQFDIDDDKMARAKPKVQKPSTNGDVPPVSETTQKTETKAIIPQPPDSSPTPLAKKPADDEEEKIADEEPDNLDDHHKGDDDPQSEGERGDEDEGQQDNVDGDEPVPQAEIRTQESTSEGKPRRKGKQEKRERRKRKDTTIDDNVVVARDDENEGEGRVMEPDKTSSRRRRGEKKKNSTKRNKGKVQWGAEISSVTVTNPTNKDVPIVISVRDGVQVNHPTPSGQPISEKLELKMFVEYRGMNKTSPSTEKGKGRNTDDDEEGGDDETDEHRSEDDDDDNESTYAILDTVTQDNKNKTGIVRLHMLVPAYKVKGIPDSQPKKLNGKWLLFVTSKWKTLRTIANIERLYKLPVYTEDNQCTTAKFAFAIENYALCITKIDRRKESDTDGKDRYIVSSRIKYKYANPHSLPDGKDWNDYLKENYLTCPQPGAKLRIDDDYVEKANRVRTTPKKRDSSAKKSPKTGHGKKRKKNVDDEKSAEPSEEGVTGSSTSTTQEKHHHKHHKSSHHEKKPTNEAPGEHKHRSKEEKPHRGETTTVAVGKSDDISVVRGDEKGKKAGGKHQKTITSKTEPSEKKHNKKGDQKKIDDLPTQNDTERPKEPATKKRKGSRSSEILPKQEKETVGDTHKDKKMTISELKKSLMEAIQKNEQYDQLGATLYRFSIMVANCIV